MNVNIKLQDDNSKMSNLLLLFYVLLFLKFLYVEKIPLIGIFASYSCSFLAIGCTIFFFFYKLKDYYKIQICIALMTFFGYTASVFTENYRFTDYLLIIQYFGLGLVPLFYKLNHNTFKCALYFIISFFLINIITGVNPNEVFSVSRNSISVFLLIFFCYYLISAIQNNLKYSLLPLIICFFISIWAMGRGGIISLGVLLFFMPFCKYRNFNFKVISFYLLIIIIAYYAYIYLQDTFMTNSISRFQSMGISQNGREGPNSFYMSSLNDSWFNFFYGVSLPGNYQFEVLDLNPHNSLIRLHIYYGLGGFIIMCVLIINSIFKYISNNNFVYILLIGVLLIRSTVDSTAFHGPFDGIIYYLIFSTIYNTR